MKKVFVSVLLALSFCLPFVTSVVVAADVEPPVSVTATDEGINQAGVGDFIDNAAKYIGYLNDFIDGIKYIYDAYKSGNLDYKKIAKDVTNTVLNKAIQHFIPFFPNLDFVGFISDWVSGRFSSIYDSCGAEVEQLCFQNRNLMAFLNDEIILIDYEDLGEFCAILYGENATIGAVYDNVKEGTSSFLTNVLGSVSDFCVNNEICLAFLTFTFLYLGCFVLSRVSRSMGRGR